MLMGHFPGHPVQRHQPGSVTLLQRGLGNQLFRQIIIKIMGLQWYFLRNIAKNLFI